MGRRGCTIRGDQLTVTYGLLILLFRHTATECHSRGVLCVYVSGVQYKSKDFQHEGVTRIETNKYR